MIASTSDNLSASQIVVYISPIRNSVKINDFTLEMIKLVEREDTYSDIR